MKNIILSACLICTSAMFGQITRGSMTLTGIVGVSGGKNLVTSTNGNITATTNDQKTSSFAFVPSFTYFLSDRIEAGIALGLTKTTTNSDFHIAPGNPGPATQKVESPFNGVALLGNYYFVNESRFGFYGGLQLGVGGGTQKVTTTFLNAPNTIVETKNSGSTFGLNTGFVYFVRHNWALNASLGLLSFNSTKSETENSGTTTNSKSSGWVFGVNGVMVNIGVKFFLSGGNGAPATTTTTTP